MINNWKLGFKILRHGYGLVMSIVQGIAFFLFGGLFLFLQISTNNFRGGIPGQVVFLCIGMLPVQMLYSLSVSNLILTSPVRKKLQTSVPAVLAWSCVTFLYLVVALVRAVMAWNLPEIRSSVCSELVLLGLVAMAMMLYLGSAYKYFVLSLLFLFPIIFISVNMGMPVELNWTVFNQGKASLILAAAIGLACIGVVAIGEYLISLLVYKRPMSKMAQAAPLRKEL